MAQARESIRDVGLGKAAQQRELTRILNRDGSFNVEKIGQPLLRAMSPYHTLVSVRWHIFFALVTVFYVLVNLLFALAYVACGPHAFLGITFNSFADRFLQCFFFSVQTIATIGYGSLSPGSLPVHLLVVFESLIGLFFVALVTGLVFARFARPRAKVMFSEIALIAPFNGAESFQFRMINQRKSQLFEPRVQVIYSRLEESSGHLMRRYFPLQLFLDRVTFFPLYWTVTHPINEESPISGVTPKQLEDERAEFLILFRAVDEISADTVHQSCSYRFDEIVFERSFDSMYVDLQSARPKVDVRKLGATRPV